MIYKVSFTSPKLPSALRKHATCYMKLHKKLGRVSKNIVREFRVDKILGIQLEDAISVVEDLVDIHIKNLVYENDFRKAREKILLFPHCCRKYMGSRCKADFDPNCSSYFCNHCPPDCLVNHATTFAEEKGYNVFVLPGGSCIKKILASMNCDGVLGNCMPGGNKIRNGICRIKRIGGQGDCINKKRMCKHAVQS